MVSHLDAIQPPSRTGRDRTRASRPSYGICAACIGCQPGFFGRHLSNGHAAGLFCDGPDICRTGLKPAARNPGPRTTEPLFAKKFFPTAAPPTHFTVSHV